METLAFQILTGNGAIPLSAVAYIFVTLVTCQITIACVTLFLHRSQAHRSVIFQPVVAHFMRLWLWLTTGMVTREWVSVHRKHHARCDLPTDPHSPQHKGILKVLFSGAELYYKEIENPETMTQFGTGCPDDFIERKLYTPHPSLGIVILFVVYFVFFGFGGVCIWAMQMAWIPFFAAGVINGLGHYVGYRNFGTPDASRNLSCLAVFIGGEELHNNHHAFPGSARMSVKWWEWDIGWTYIRLLHSVGLARIMRVAPIPRRRHEPNATINIARSQMILQSKLYIVKDFIAEVMMPLFSLELKNSKTASCKALYKIKRVLMHKGGTLPQMPTNLHIELHKTLCLYRKLQTAYKFKEQLIALWKRGSTHEDFLVLIAEWCRNAEASRIVFLQKFVHKIRGFALQHSYHLLAPDATLSSSSVSSF